MAISPYLSINLFCLSSSLSIYLIYIFCYLSVCLSVHKSVCLYVCLSISLPVCLYICLPVCLSFYLSLCLSVCLFIWLFFSRDCASVCLCSPHPPLFSTCPSLLPSLSFHQRMTCSMRLVLKPKWSTVCLSVLLPFIYSFICWVFIMKSECITILPNPSYFTDYFHDSYSIFFFSWFSILPRAASTSWLLYPPSHMQ